MRVNLASERMLSDESASKQPQLQNLVFKEYPKKITEPRRHSMSRHNTTSRFQKEPAEDYQRARRQRRHTFDAGVEPLYVEPHYDVLERDSSLTEPEYLKVFKLVYNFNCLKKMCV